MTPTKLHHGIYYLDANYVQPGIAVVYLLVEQGRVAIIETGTTLSVPDILAALGSLGLGAEHVDYVIPTHIHLDHAGGAGALIRACRNAKLAIHPRGAAHMIAPEKLIAGTKMVYGEKRFKEYYGEIIPVPREKVITCEDNTEVDIAGRTLKFIDTPGHALHHFCVVDDTSAGVFTGDTFGIAYPALATDQGPFIFATTTPTQFDPDALLKSIDRIMAQNPRYIYLTHFGQIEATPFVVNQLRDSVKNQARLALGMKDVSEEREAQLAEAISGLFIDTILAQGGRESTDYYRQQFLFDSRLNAQGLEVWLKRLEKAG